MQPGRAISRCRVHYSGFSPKNNIFALAKQGMLYAVTDIETTGGSAKRERITEIAIYLFDGERVVDEFVSLVDPERSIPYYITALTGITNEMVADAPPFHQVARRIVEITEGAVFVAHNARFDYSFLRAEYKSLGYSFNRKILDTVQLSRKLLPGHRSYSLGSLCGDLGIIIKGRHRASGDALATVKLLQLLLERDREVNGVSLMSSSRHANLPPGFPAERLEQLPEARGVYYFYRSDGVPLYIGKSNNLRQRVLTHLSNNTSRRTMEMREAMADIGWEVTGSELIALLKESEEIKKHKPVYNRAQRRTSFQHGIYIFPNAAGYLCFEIRSNDCPETPLLCYSSRDQARKHLLRLVDKYELCQKLCGLYQSSGACFQYQIGVCRGACAGEEKVAEYNRRVRKALKTFAFHQNNFFIVDAGRHAEEKCVVKIRNGKYQGYGYFDVDALGFGMEALHDCIKAAGDNRDIQAILKSYLQRNKVERIIPF